MTALERLHRQISDLVEEYLDGEIDDRPLMQQLRYLGPHLAPGFGIARKTQPSSRPPGNLTAHQVYERITHESADWAWTLGGASLRQDRCLPMIPVLAQQRIDGGNEKARILYGPSGMFAAVGSWHLSARIVLGYERPADRYPEAVCPHCGVQGSIRGRGRIGWCSNRDCRDERGRRHDFDVEDLAARGVDLTSSCAR